jgi:sec-independent protein translocase protein TatB
MFNVGSGEILVILLVALIVLGPAQLPKAARQVGNVMSEIRRVSTGFQRELTTALEVEEQRQAKPTSPGGPRDLTPPAASAESPPDPGPDAAPGADEPT